MTTNKNKAKKNNKKQQLKQRKNVGRRLYRNYFSVGCLAATDNTIRIMVTDSCFGKARCKFGAKAASTSSGTDGSIFERVVTGSDPAKESVFGNVFDGNGKDEVMFTTWGSLRGHKMARSDDVASADCERAARTKHSRTRLGWCAHTRFADIIAFAQI